MPSQDIYFGSKAYERQPVALITGGTKGLGQALAQQLLARGYAVAICGRTQGLVEGNVTAWNQWGPVMGVVGDLSEQCVADRLLHAVVEHWGRLDVLVNNASTLGIVPLPSLRSFDTENCVKVFQLNVVIPLYLVSRALPYLDRCGGISVAISSDAAIGGYEGWAVYGSAKAALDLAYATLANEEPHLRVYSVDPGDMDTEMHHAAIPGDPGPLRDPGDVAQAIISLLVDSAPQSLFPSGSRLIVRETHMGLQLQGEHR